MLRWIEVSWSCFWSVDHSMIITAIADDKIPINDPWFYSDETRCPDSLIEHVFRPADSRREPIPLLKERISVMREVGKKLCDVRFFFVFRAPFPSSIKNTHSTIQEFNGSYLYFIQSLHKRHNGQGTALDLVKMVTEYFPSFRDETWIDGHKGTR